MQYVSLQVGRRKNRFHKALVGMLLCLSCWTVLFSPHTAVFNLIFVNRASSDMNCLAVPNPADCYNNIGNGNGNTTTNTSIEEHQYSYEYSHPNFTFELPLCLVHVGKTAGSSISCGLGLMYADCEGMPRDPPLPHVHYFHMRKNNCLQGYENNTNKDIATYLMLIRNPITRIRSWFNFEKDIVPSRRNKHAEERLRWKRGMIFTECYDNFVDLVTKGVGTINDLRSFSGNNNGTYEILSERPINMTCPERALAALLGVREFSYHEWYNYEHYWTTLQNHHQRLFDGNNHSRSLALSPSLLVLRTEHLYADWTGLAKEDLFRHVNKGNRSAGSNFTKDGDDVVSENDYSSRYWVNLCYAMCPEIQIYKQILQRSNNLNVSQVLQSISEVQMMCPEESSSVRSCPGIPRFPLLKLPRKEYVKEAKKRLFTIK